jgi:hypothetical protein
MHQDRGDSFATYHGGGEEPHAGIIVLRNNLAGKKQFCWKINSCGAQFFAGHQFLATYQDHPPVMKRPYFRPLGLPLLKTPARITALEKATDPFKPSQKRTRVQAGESYSHPGK